MRRAIDRQPANFFLAYTAPAGTKPTSRDTYVEYIGVGPTVDAAIESATHTLSLDLSAPHAPCRLYIHCVQVIPLMAETLTEDIRYLRQGWASLVH